MDGQDLPEQLYDVSDCETSPFERLLSAYRNKFVDTLPSSKYFQSRYGRHIIRRYRPNASKSDLLSGANVNFREFVIYLLKEGANTNEHWTPCTSALPSLHPQLHLRGAIRDDI
ncbi:hypothetical protein NQ317_013524 [Molorchus minor]|uniref:Carbohydrate sulfotransferase n=1 Tax=Molorchus minor TaxID=1323400 RepID=A0ABQ9JY07_9CUCU|nr:hypothetical protein NQ317_013524 [Molorchus minor]